MQHEPKENGFVWDVAGDADLNNGHCIIAYGYNGRGVFVDTWGMSGTVTWAALGKYFVPGVGGEVHTVLSQDWINSAVKTAPNGFAFASLQADLQAIA